MDSLVWPPMNFIDGKFLRLGDQIVKRKVHARHCHAGHAAEAIRQGGTVHLVPDQLYIERILANEKSFEMLVNNAAGKCAAAVVRAKTAHAFVRENLDDKRVLSAAHPQRTDARVFGMDGHGIGNERLRLPAAAPVLRFAHRRAARAGVAGFDGLKFDVSNFHLKLAWFSDKWLRQLVHRTAPAQQ